MVFEGKMLTYDDPEEEEEDPPAEEEEGDGGEGEEEEEEDEAEMVDPLETLREKCEKTERCVQTRERLEVCQDRVSSRSRTEEECTEELFDFLHARDHCVAHKLFHDVK